MTQSLGDAPIEDKYIDIMNALARGVDKALNPASEIAPGLPAGNSKKGNGFLLLVFPINGHDGRCNYISNADRKDIIVLMKEQIKRFEGQPEVSGTA